MKRDKIYVKINYRKKKIRVVRPFEIFRLDKEEYHFNDFAGIIYKTKFQIKDKTKPMFLDGSISFRRKNINKEILIMSSKYDRILYRKAFELSQKTKIPNLLGDFDSLQDNKQKIRY